MASFVTYAAAVTQASVQPGTLRATLGHYQEWRLPRHVRCPHQPKAIRSLLCMRHRLSLHGIWYKGE